MCLEESALLEHEEQGVHTILKANPGKGLCWVSSIFDPKAG